MLYQQKKELDVCDGSTGEWGYESELIMKRNAR